jgi:sugar phosphate isomerase/epimerase
VHYYSRMADSSRRQFLQAVAASAAAMPFAGGGRLHAAPKHNLPGVLGLELYTLRHLLEKDVPGTLKLVKDWGFEDVEGGGLPGKTAAEFKALLGQYGLRMQSMLTGYEKLRDDLASVVKDAKDIGCSYVGTSSIPHQGPVTRQHIDQASSDFAKWGKAVAGEGLQFFYHVHGYEFGASPDGTLLDTLMKQSPKDVAFQMDVFWVMRGGGDPAALLAKYPGRFLLMHLKDIAKGTPLGDPTGAAPDETSVPLGTGQVNWPAVLKAAKAGGTKMFYIEDEHPKAEDQVPATLKYLAELSV